MPAYALHFAPLCDDKISKKHQKEKPSSQLQQHCEEMVEALSASNSAEENILVIQSAAFAGRRMLRSPKNDDEALRHIQLLSGRRHRVLTAILLKYNGRHYKRVIETGVHFKLLTSDETAYYVNNKLWHSKRPGAYDPLGYEGRWIKSTQGSLSNLFGCPLYELNALLKGAGLL